MLEAGKTTDAILPRPLPGGPFLSGPMKAFSSQLSVVAQGALRCSLPRVTVEARFSLLWDCQAVGFTGPPQPCAGQAESGTSLFMQEGLRSIGWPAHWSSLQLQPSKACLLLS